MWTRFLHVLWLVLFGLAHTAMAATTSEQQLADLLGAMESTQGKFYQVIYSRHGQALQTTVGTFALHRPGLFRWQTLSPSPQLLVADGKKVWLYDRDLNQVSWFAEQVNNKQSPAMLLVGKVESLAKLYRITVKQEAQQAVFQLSPRQASFFETVQLVFDEGELSQMTIHDNLGQMTRIDFSELSDEASLDLFQFVPPKGVDIVQAAV